VGFKKSGWIFWVGFFYNNPAAKSLGHLLKASVTCTNKNKRCCYLPFSLSLVYSELHNVYGWHCNVFSGHFHCV